MNITYVILHNSYKKKIFLLQQNEKYYINKKMSP